MADVKSICEYLHWLAAISVMAMPSSAIVILLAIKTAFLHACGKLIQILAKQASKRQEYAVGAGRDS